MGWWYIDFDPTTNGCIGDPTADILDEALKRLINERSANGLEKPNLQDYLDAFTALLQIPPRHYIYEEGRWLEARHVIGTLRHSNGTIATSTGCPSPYDESIFYHCGLALDAIASTYWEVRGRSPRLREILATLEFVLLEDYCSSLSDDLSLKIGAHTRVSPHWYLITHLGMLFPRALSLTVNALGPICPATLRLLQSTVTSWGA